MTIKNGKDFFPCNTFELTLYPTETPNCPNNALVSSNPRANVASSVVRRKADGMKLEQRADNISKENI